MTVLKHLKNISIVLLLLAIMSGLSATSEASNKNIRVGLASGKTTLTVSSSSAYSMTDSRGKQINIQGNLSISEQGPTGKVLTNQGTFHLPLTVSGKGYKIYNKRKYRGSFRIIKIGKGLNLINVLDVEDYLRGVLKMEVNPNWPFEALKAQAIISRTYAFRHINRHSKNGFDVCDLPHCQVYRGVNAEDQVLDRAVKETKGLVVVFNGSIALTPFHSDSGGATADVRTVWGGQLPYLKAVKEPVDYVSPYSAWTTTLNSTDIQKMLRAKGIDIGKVKGLEVAQQNSFGRADIIRVIGTKGSKALSSHAFRMAIGSKTIKSTMFTISTTNSKRNSFEKNGGNINHQASAPKLSFVDEHSSDLNIEEEKLMTVLTKQGFFNAEQMIDMLLHPNKRKSYLIKALERRPANSKIQSRNKLITGSEFVLKGKGWGHGVGLSQWGAKNLAENGWESKQIINHYYHGTRIQKYY